MKHKLENKVKRIVHAQCENEFLRWKYRIIGVTEEFNTIAPGLRLRLERFANENKPSFFKEYSDKIEKTLDQLISRALRTDFNDLNNMPLDELTDRVKLEAYLENNKNCAKTARQLGICRTTFLYWITKNEEMILSEERKGEL